MQHGININVLYTEAGEVLTETPGIKHEAIYYFQRFLQAETSRTNPISMEDLQSLMRYRCSSHDTAHLISPITPIEVLNTLKALPNGKAPGPDGYTKKFFIASWSVV